MPEGPYIEPITKKVKRMKPGTPYSQTAMQKETELEHRTLSRLRRDPYLEAVNESLKDDGCVLHLKGSRVIYRRPVYRYYWQLDPRNNPNP